MSKYPLFPCDSKVSGSGIGRWQTAGDSGQATAGIQEIKENMRESRYTQQKQFNSNGRQRNTDSNKKSPRKRQHSTVESFGVHYQTQFSNDQPRMVDISQHASRE